MSLSDSLYIGASGLTTMGDAMGIVGDNISNSSTIGYKSNRAEFADILGGQLGSQALGDGVELSGSETQWTQGSIQQTGNPNDVAITGGGMFEVKGTSGAASGTFYTRDGSFQVDNNGYLTNQAGLRVQGYPIDSSGTRSTSVGDLALGAHESAAVPSGNAAMTLNLDASSTTPTGAWDPANAAATSNYSTSVTEYDSTGAAHQVDTYFRNDGGGAWEYHAMVDGKDVTGGTPGTPTEIASGTLQFNTNGSLQSQAVTTSSANFVNATPGQVLKFNFGDDIASGGTGLSGSTSYSSASTVTAATVDGHSAGSLTSISIGADGTVQGTYDNGDKLNIAQLSLASFANPEGLTRIGSGLMAASNTSGQALSDVPGTGSRGSLSSGALESSNVDLGNELVTLIAYQQAFQANSKTVTTADQMLQTVDQLKQ